MPRITTPTRISFALSTLTVSILLVAHCLGFVPEFKSFQAAEAAASRTLAESVAIQCSLAAERSDLATIRTLVGALVKRSDLIHRVIVRHASGHVIAQAEKPAAEAESPTSAVATFSQFSVPVFRDQQRWGTVDFEFLPVASPAGPSWLGTPLLPLAVVLGLSSFLTFTWYLHRVLTHLDPSAVIPDRVRTAMDTLAEGVVILDCDERVVLANEAFARSIDRPAKELFGKNLSSLRWIIDEPLADDQLPWARVLQEGTPQTGVRLCIQGTAGALHSLSVNAVPVQGSDRVRRGVLVTFDDLTVLEEKNATLGELLKVLERSHNEIQVQNEELQFLATRDPLTSCYNRRAFFSRVEQLWEPALAQGESFGCIMVDIDHFKAFNDNHGHAVGDKVLQHVAGLLREGVHEQDVVCRYGGEEFCILLPGVNLPAAAEMAEQLRRKIETTPCDQLAVTASIGVSIADQPACVPQATLDQADKALYGSKRNGRNRVTTWQQLVDRGETDLKPEKSATRGRNAEAEQADRPFSMQAIETLFNALAHRDRPTAEHSRRVANLCVVIGQQFLPEKEVYILEAAALLHDIGKLGVPDSVLLKPGPLTSEEWQIMNAHDDLGSDLVGTIFGCEELKEIVRTHHAWYQGNPRDPNLPTAENIPVGARILAMADAYDAIVSDRVYRIGKSHEEALAELNRCAGVQFDPDLVAKFSDTLNANKTSTRTSSARPQNDIRRSASMESVQSLVRNLAALAQQSDSKSGNSSPSNSEAALLATAGELVELCQSAQQQSQTQVANR